MYRSKNIKMIHLSSKRHYWRDLLSGDKRTTTSGRPSTDPPAVHRPLPDCSPMKQCCSRSTLDSFPLHTCDTVICDWRHPNQQHLFSLKAQHVFPSFFSFLLVQWWVWGELYSKMRAQLILTSLQRWKCYLNTLQEVCCVDSSFRWITLMIFLPGGWSTSGAAAKQQSDNFLW